MAPKADKGKVVKSTEAQRLAALRKKWAIFPPKLAARELRENYYCFWSTETRAHPRTSRRLEDGSKWISILRLVLLLRALSAFL